MYFRRIAEQPLKDILAGDKVGILLGARQVGKTTLVEHVLAGQSAFLLELSLIWLRTFLSLGSQLLRFRVGLIDQRGVVPSMAWVEATAYSELVPY